MPIASLAGDLAADELHVVVFGPGYGESVAVHVPPGEWLVVDSLAANAPRPSFIPALELLQARGETAAAVLLTHPHDDHAAGLDRLITSRTQGAVGVLDVYVPEAGFTEQPDAASVLAVSNRTKTLQAIAAYWQEHPEHEWRLVADGAVRSVGDGDVEVLHPDAAFIAAGVPDPAVSPNQYSSPVLVRWHGARVVLGADLPEAEWRVLLARLRTTPLAEHAALKVPHHGSTGALADEICLLAQSRASAAVTPWNRGRQILPRFGAGQGVEWLLSRRQALAITSLGRGLNRRLPSEVPYDDVVAAVELRDVADGVVQEVRLSADPDESWVALSFAADGALTADRYGAAARRITS
jgi:beta-lactamase superfamily II metal-dependent hydrolase